MGARYYIDHHELKTPREFDPAILWHIEKSNQGEVCLESANFKIAYDCDLGLASLIVVNKSPDVHHVFSASFTKALTQPIQNALMLIAKIELLRGLSQLGDQHIATIVAKAESKIQSAKTVHAIHKIVEHTLDHIYEFAATQKNHPAKISTRLFFSTHKTEKTPTQHAIQSALMEHPSVNSKADVQTILTAIQNKLQHRTALKS